MRGATRRSFKPLAEEPMKVFLERDVVIEVDRWRGGIPRLHALSQLIRAGIQSKPKEEGENRG